MLKPYSVVLYRRYLAPCRHRDSSKWHAVCYRIEKPDLETIESVERVCETIFNREFVPTKYVKRFTRSR